MRYRARIIPLREGHRQEDEARWEYTYAQSLAQASRFLRQRYPEYVVEEPIADPREAGMYVVTNRYIKGSAKEIKASTPEEACVKAGWPQDECWARPMGTPLFGTNPVDLSKIRGELVRLETDLEYQSASSEAFRESIEGAINMMGTCDLKAALYEFGMVIVVGGMLMHRQPNVAERIDNIEDELKDIIATIAEEVCECKTSPPEEIGLVIQEGPRPFEETLEEEE